MPETLPPAQEHKVVDTPIAGTVGNLRVFGVPIRLHFTFLLLLVFLIFIGIGGKQSGATTSVYIIALFGSVLVHELCHALVARMYGLRTREIVMFPIGGVSRLESQPKPRQEPLIALAGPAANLIIGLVLLATQHGFLPLEKLSIPTDANLIERIALGNLILGLCCRPIQWMAGASCEHSSRFANQRMRPRRSRRGRAGFWPWDWDCSDCSHRILYWCS